MTRTLVLSLLWLGLSPVAFPASPAAGDDAGAAHFVNPGQRWRVAFDGDGFRAHPFDATWSWGLALESWGFEGEQRTPRGPADVRREDARVTYAWGDGLEEWFVDDARGLEHGFTLRERPSGNVDGPLTFALAVRGGLQPRVEAGGRDVRFVDDDGRTRVRYDGLVVFDADGVDLAARFEVAADGLRLFVDERGARYPLTVDPVAYQAYLKASNTDAADSFGDAVALSGDTLVVGAAAEDSVATGVGGDELDDTADGAGAVYVFVRTGGTWVQQAYLKASNTDAGDRFGSAVAISGDTLVVGAPGEASAALGVGGDELDDTLAEAGAAYVFVRSASAWTQEAYLKASNTGAGDRFGSAVAVSGDTVVVGAPGEASAAVGVGGNEADDSASGAGAGYVFVRNASVWTQEAYLKASNTDPEDAFGSSVSLSGDTAAVAAPGEDSSAAGVDGDGSDNGAGGAGAAYVFTRSAGAWSEAAYVKAINTGTSDGFGASLAVSGDTLLVGAIGEASAADGVNGNPFDDSAPFAGAAYVYVDGGAGWLPQAYLKASNSDGTDLFGWSVALAGERAAVGALWEGSDSTGVGGDQGIASPTYRGGAAYVFERNGVLWSQTAYVKASNTDDQDAFGTAVALSNEVLAVSATGEDSGATGVDGDQDDDLTADAGAVYTYDLQAAFNPYCVQTLPTSVPGCFSLLTISDATLATGSWDTTNIPRSGTIPDGNTLGIYIFTNGVGQGQSTFALPSSLGTICLQGLKRSSAYCPPLALPATSGLCNTGVMSLPLSCNAGAMGLAVGDDVNVQLWHRDPTTTDFGQSRVSNAVFYTVQ